MSDAPKPEHPEASLAGHEPALTGPAERERAFAQAVDYRGDVTLGTADGTVIEGYVFDRRGRGGGAVLRLVTPDGGRVEVPCQAVVRMVFSGRDPAAGRSWEAWVRKYAQKKARGESANLYSEPLE